MREEAKRDGSTRTSLSPSHEEWEKSFEAHFGRAWDASLKEQVLAAVRTRTDAVLLFREIERVVVGAAALKRMLDGVPPPREELPPVFLPDRKHDERYLLVWAFEEGLVPFASGPGLPPGTRRCQPSHGVRPRFPGRRRRRESAVTHEEDSRTVPSGPRSGHDGNHATPCSGSRVARATRRTSAPGARRAHADVRGDDSPERKCPRRDGLPPLNWHLPRYVARCQTERRWQTTSKKSTGRGTCSFARAR